MMVMASGFIARAMLRCGHERASTGGAEFATGTRATGPVPRETGRRCSGRPVLSWRLGAPGRKPDGRSFGPYCGRFVRHDHRIVRAAATWRSAAKTAEERPPPLALKTPSHAASRTSNIFEGAEKPTTCRTRMTALWPSILCAMLRPMFLKSTIKWSAPPSARNTFSTGLRGEGEQTWPETH